MTQNEGWSASGLRIREGISRKNDELFSKSPLHAAAYIPTIVVPHNITKYRKKKVTVTVFSHFGTTFWHDEGSISLALISSLISCYIKLQFGPPFCPRRHRPEKEKILGSRPNAKQHQLSSGDLSPAANANIHCFSSSYPSYVVRKGRRDAY